MEERSLKKEINDEPTIMNSDTLENKADMEERRGNRIASVIALLASLWALGRIVYKLTLVVMNVWPTAGWMYRYLQGLFVLSVSIITIIIIDMTVYIFVELKRYNNLDSKHKKYDKISDEKYNCMVSDYTTYVGIFFLIYILVISLSAKYYTGFQRYNIVLLSLGIVVLRIIFLIKWLKKKENKKYIKKGLKSIFEKIGKLAIVGLVFYLLGLTYITNTKATIKVSYNVDGMVEFVMLRQKAMMDWIL